MDNKNKIIWSILLGFIPVIWTLFLYFHGVLDSAEDSIIDKKHLIVNPNRAISDKIVILDIDEDSLKKFGKVERYGRWPWKRSVYPEILSYIASGDPKLIIFDILFQGESPDDEILAHANEQIPHISHASSFLSSEDDAEQEGDASVDFIEKHSIKVDEKDKSVPKFNRVLLPNGDIGFKSPHLHSVTYKSDSDGMSRKYRYLVNYRDKYYPSLALMSFNALEPIKSLSHSLDSMVIQTEKRAINVPLENGFLKLSFYPRSELYDSYKLKRIPISWVIDSIRDMEAGKFTSYDELKIQPAEYRDKIIIPSKFKGKVSLPGNLDKVVVYYDDIKDKAYIPGGLETKIILPEKYLRYASIPSELHKEVAIPEDILTPDAFKDKVVIIGTSATATFDSKTIPYGKIPGVVIHAVALSNILQEDFIKVIPNWITFSLIIVMTAISSILLVVSKSSLSRIMVPFTFIVTYIAASLILFKYNVHLNLSIFGISYPISFAAFLGYMILIEGAEKRKYSKILGNMVDPTIVSEALNDLEALKKGGEMEITAFFSDVAGFSTISEQLTSQQLAALLNEYLSAMTIILKENHGTLDKYIGDAVVGIFGAPLPTTTHFLDAAKASLQMLKKLEELKAFWKANNLYIPDAQTMNIRIGLNTGIAKVGFMGTDTLASYTMMGDTVNLAARLEAAGKDYGVSILISETVKKRVENEMFTRELDAVVVKGKTEPVRIYELIGEKGNIPANIEEATNLYQDAFNLHLNRQWDEAIAKFEKSMKVKGSKDKSALMLIERCEGYKVNPPPANWNGAYVRTHK